MAVCVMLHDDPSRVAGHITEVDRKITRLNSSHGYISYAVFCLKKKKQHNSGPGLVEPAHVATRDGQPGTSLLCSHVWPAALVSASQCDIYTLPLTAA